LWTAGAGSALLVAICLGLVFEVRWLRASLLLSTAPFTTLLAIASGDV
jgi:hypothetical protein